MLEFTKVVEAAERAAGADDEAPVVEVNVWGLKAQARMMSMTQAALLSVPGRRVSEQVGAVLSAVEGMMGLEARSHVERLLMAGHIELSDLLGGNERNPKGLLNAIWEEFRAHPSQPPTDSSKSRIAGGRRSTGRSRGPGSIPGDSPQTASSTPSTSGPSET